MSAIKCAGLWPKSAVQITPTLFLCTGRPRARRNFCCTQLDVLLRALAMYSSVCHSSSQCVPLVTITLNCHGYRYHWLNDFFFCRCSPREGLKPTDQGKEGPVSHTHTGCDYNPCARPCTTENLGGGAIMNCEKFCFNILLLHKKYTSSFILFL